MKVAVARGITRSRVPLIAMLALAATIGLAGCEGDSVGDAAAGPTGPTGGVGPTGPTGPTVPPVPDIGQGGPVTIGNGSALTADQIAAIDTLVATLDSAAVTNNRAVIEFTVKTAQGGPVLGLAPTTLRLGIAKLEPAAAGVPSGWQSYVNRRATPGNTSAGFVPALPNAIQANTESGVAGDCAVATAACWQELGNGAYRYRSAVDLSTVTSPIAVPYDPSLTHRVSFAIDLSGAARELAPDNPFLDFVPAGGTVTSNKRIAATANCADCHARFAEHGGPRRSNEYCVVCHNPGSIDPDGGESVDMAYMAHSIHRAGDRSTPYVVFGFGGTKYSYENVTYPQSVLFCETCHTQSADAPQGNDWLVNVSASSCGGCHDAGLLKTGPEAATGRYVYQYQHTIASSGFDFAANDGDCQGCHRAGGVAGETLEVHRQGERLGVELGRAYQYSILSATNTAAGQTPTVTFQILKDGQPIDVKALTTGRLRLDFAWSTDDIHNVADLTPGQEQYLNNEGQSVWRSPLSAAADRRRTWLRSSTTATARSAIRWRVRCRRASTATSWSCWKAGVSRTARRCSPPARSSSQASRGCRWSSRPSARTATSSSRPTVAAGPVIPTSASFATTRAAASRRKASGRSHSAPGCTTCTTA
jgi:OmcA/MtrC family decaheme c-type cytochrome